MQLVARRLLVGAAIVVAPLSLAAAEKPTEKITPDQLAFFEKKIRPVLVAKCYKCHSAESEKVKGGLLLDTREGTRMGGATGHAVEPGDLKGSLLITALHGEKKDSLMPPKEKLPPEVIADFEKWVLMGAPDPRDGKTKVAKKPDLAEAKSFWSFQPVKPVAVPQPKDASWSTLAVDRFVRRKQEEKRLTPVGEADPATFLRRLHFDLVGLPPSPEQVQAFVKECGPAGRIPAAAVEKVVEKLLASSQFGERWGRHWLDVARYGESCGKERNYAFPEAWRYRDYVIASVNADKPYDKFIREQVAGDLLPAKDAAQRNEQLIATGFLAMGPKGLNEKNREAFLMEQVDEQIDVTTRAVLGLTVSCARCHDHKFDPIPTRDYYAVAGIFKSTETHFGIGGGNNGKNRQPSTHIPLVKSYTPPPPLAKSVEGVQVASASSAKKLTPEMEAKLKKLADKNPRLTERFKQMSEAEKVEAYERIEGGGKLARTAKKAGKYPETPDAPKPLGDPSGEWAMGVLDGKAADCPIYVRGELEEKGPVIPRGFVTVLGATGPAKITPGQSGRLELARWLTSPENPLTARVMANRVWQHLFGEGIVSTPDNFGATGERPSNPELLDYLASRLVSNGWSLKQLVREIVLSRTYRLSSASDAKNFATDPDNDFLWRANQRRLDAEAIRDGILAASGRLDLTPARGSAVSEMGDAPLGKGGNTSQLTADSRHRSVYLPIVREQLPEALDLFDFAEPSLVVAAREVTTVPSQALYMLNSPFVYNNAAAMAKRFQGTSADLTERIQTAYLTALSRPPTAAESARAEAYLKAHAAERGGSPESALTTFCQALFASAEFRYVK